MAKKAVEQNTSLAPSDRGPNVAFQRLELTNMLPQYDLIRDCIEGSQKIKKAQDKYLPIPNAEDGGELTTGSRYQAYLKRAVFYNVTKRTLAGLIGQVFLRDPVSEYPTLLDPLKDDFSGSGVSMDQFAFMATGENIAYGRLGVLIDYPDVDVPATQADLQSGKVRPAVLMYPSRSIINWRTIVKNGREILSLVVIFEQAIIDDDGFEQLYQDVWRVLSLDKDGLYQVQLYEKTSGNFSVSETYFPKDAKGNRLTEIPFTFVGVFNNNASVDEPPMYDMAELNIAHYRNSADYEEACFLCGQPTLALSGLTEDWVNNVMNGKVALGSRGAIMLPTNGKAELIQAQENTMPKEAMDAKERQMVALGAKLVEQKTVQRTLGEAELENTAETSILGSIAKNVEKAMVFALTWCARFVGADENGIKYELNTEFDLTQLDFNERGQTLKEWQAGAITFSEMRQNLRRGGIASLDDDKAKAELKQDKTDGVGPPVPPPANDPNNPNSGKPPASDKPAAA